MDRGVVLNELERFGVEEIELDEPGPGEARVRIEATGVCHSDLHVVRTGHNHPLPVLLGHEGAGVVEAVGEGVEHVRPGDSVVVGWRSPCGACRWCQRGAEHLCRTPPMAVGRMHSRDGRDLMGVFRAGTFATRTVLHGASLVRLPVELPPEQACLLGCAIATGVCSVLKTAEVWEGARVAVIGCGAVGLSVVQGARVAGAAEIHAIDLDERKLEAARRFGATHTGTPRPSGSTSCSTSSGYRRRWPRGWRCSAMPGRSSTSACPSPAPKRSLPLESTFDRRVRILVSHGGDHVPAEDFPRLAELAVDGRLDLAGMVTKRIKLDDVGQAFEDMEAGEVIRSVIVL